VGGMDYTFALRSDGQTPTQIMRLRNSAGAGGGVGNTEAGGPGSAEPLLKMIPPRPPEYERGREDFKIRTSPALTRWLPRRRRHSIRYSFCSIRSGRHGWSSFMRGIPRTRASKVLDTVTAVTWRTPHVTGYWWEISRVVDNVCYTT